MAVSSKHRGWKWDAANSRLSVYVNGTEVARFDDAEPYFEPQGGINLPTAKTLTSADTMLVATKALAQKSTQTALTATATVTAAQLLTLVLDGTPTAAATYTLPTAALLVAAIQGAAVGTSFYFLVNNKSAGAYTITVAGGSGSTDDGTLTVAQNVIRGFFVIITNITSGSEAYGLYGLGA